MLLYEWYPSLSFLSLIGFIDGDILNIVEGSFQVPWDCLFLERPYGSSTQTPQQMCLLSLNKGWKGKEITVSVLSFG